MLTALGSADDVVKGFNLGADDYITKPFTFKELIVRIEAVFRRLDWMQQPPPAQVIVNGELRVDVDSRQVWLRDAEIHLTPIEFQLLHYLMARPGQGVSKEDLFGRCGVTILAVAPTWWRWASAGCARRSSGIPRTRP